MSEEDVVKQTRVPPTVASMAKQLRSCGMERGQTVLLHMSLSVLGWVVGGAEAVIKALQDVLGEDGTLMMPTHTSGNTDPQAWQHPPVPEDWWPLIREHTPGYSPTTTPTRSMGAVPELFRTWPGAIRSAHPVTSFAALGPKANYLTADHELEEAMGGRSPLGKLYDLDGYVMLLGVGHQNNTSLHLAEFRANYPGKSMVVDGSAILVNGVRKWVIYSSLDNHDEDFGELGTTFETLHEIRIHRIGRAEVRLFKQRVLVDFAVDWMEKNRDLTR